jgi:hypothetical protein
VAGNRKWEVRTNEGSTFDSRNMETLYEMETRCEWGRGVTHVGGHVGEEHMGVAHT